MVPVHGTRHQTAGHHLQTLRRRRPVSRLNETDMHCKALRGLFDGARRQDKQDDKFHELYIFANQKNDFMRGEDIQFYFSWV